MSSKAKKIDNTEQDDSTKNVCGIIMPIADTPTYPKGHWTDVYNILSEAASSAGFEPNMVSFDDVVDFAHTSHKNTVRMNSIFVP